MNGSTVALILAVGLLMLLLASVVRGNLAAVEIEGSTLVVRMRGLNKLWAFRNRIELPLRSVTGVEVKSKLDRMPIGLRMPGTSIPGVIIVGSYRSEGHRSFYAIRRGEDVLVIDLEGAKYQRIVVETSEPQMRADAIRSARRSMR